MEQIRLWRIKTFTKWINARIFEKYGPSARFVKNFEKDLCDGAFLVNLAVALYGMPNPPFKRATVLPGMIRNVQVAFSLFKSVGIPCEWFNPEEIARGNVDASLNLIWLIIMHSDLKRFLPNKPVESSLEAMTRDCNAQLVAWMQRRLQFYGTVQVVDLTTSFQDGMALAALTHFMRIDAFSFLQCSPQTPEHNLLLAVSKALQFCNIPALMDVADFMGAGPDEACVMTYLAEFLKYYRKKWNRKNFKPLHERHALPPGGIKAVVPGQVAQQQEAPQSAYEKGRFKWEIPYHELRLETEIGRGAFGVVYIGRWRMQKVAVKQLQLQGDKMSQSELEEFMGEAELMMSLRPHKNVVQMLGLSIDPSQPLCLVTDFQPGGSLHGLLKSDKPIDWPTVVHILEGVSAGMYHIHREHILHRDLAARNVLLSASNDAMVADFGLSAQTTSGTTQETYFKGALKYMAPESLRHNMFSTKSDVWSFGVLAWELITRSAPFASMDIYTAAKKIQRGKTLPLPLDCPSPVALVLDQSWCQQPESRPSFDQFEPHFNAMRREMARYPPLPLLLPGESGRAGPAPGLHTASSSLPNPNGGTSGYAVPGARPVSLGATSIQNAQLAAVSAVEARRRSTTDLHNTGHAGDLSLSVGAPLVGAGHDVAAAAARAAEEYAAMSHAASEPHPTLASAGDVDAAAMAAAAGYGVSSGVVDSSEGAAPEAARTTYIEDVGGNQYDMLPSELEAAQSMHKQQTKSSTLVMGGLPEARRVSLPVRGSATMTLPNRPKSKASKSARPREPVPIVEDGGYGLAPPPALVDDSSDSSEGGEQALKTEEQRRLEAESLMQGYGVAPPAEKKKKKKKSKAGDEEGDKKKKKKKKG